MDGTRRWDVAVVGGGPAGLNAACAAASAGASVIVVERATHPRCKTCGGGMIGLSVAAVPAGMTIPSRADVDELTFTLRGRSRYTRRSSGGTLLHMVDRADLDDALRRHAESLGVHVLQGTKVRALVDHGDRLELLTSGTGPVAAAVVVGADGSAGVTSRFVGVEFGQTDLGLERELELPPALRDQWRKRALLDWGELPGSYAWIFPKGDHLTVGAIAERGSPDATREYLDEVVRREGLGSLETRHASGHLTRCRTRTSPVRRGRVLVAGEAAGLLEPWTREGISYALRSGALAGRAAAAAALGGTTAPIEGYEAGIADLVREMAAGDALLAVFRRRPGAVHLGIRLSRGWRLFSRVCRGETTLGDAMRSRRVRWAVRLLA